MKYLSFEFLKLRSRTWIWALALGTMIILPLTLKIIMNLEYLDNQVAEGQFMEHAAYGFISFSTLYIFIPLWIIAIVGIEFSNGHVHQVVFNRSFKFYYISKILYCISVSLIFSIVGVYSLVIIQVTAPFKPYVSSAFYFVFFAQCFVTFFAQALLLMAIVFLTRSPMIAFISYFIISFTESIIFSVVNRVYAFQLYFLPFHFANIFYVKSGEPKIEKYYNPFLEFDSRVLLLIFFLALILFLAYKDFTKRDLKPLSD